MTAPLAIVPARAGSKGLKDKNRQVVGRQSLLQWAVETGCEVAERVIVTSDIPWGPVVHDRLTVISRDAELCRDETPMVDVVTDVLGRVPGPPDQPILLIQPSTYQPLRARVRVCADALELFRTSPLRPTSVVTVAPIDGRLAELRADGLLKLPRASRRQDVRPKYKLTGACFCLLRGSVEAGRGLYGPRPVPLVVGPYDAVTIDTAGDLDQARRMA